MITEVSPHSVQAEQEVIGAVFFNQTAMAEIVDILEPEDFYRSPHRYIFEALTELFKKGEPLDIIHAGEWLSDHESLEAAGGRPYLMDLALGVATSGAIKYHAQIVKNYSVRRALQALGHELIVMAQTESGEDSLEFVQAKMLEIAQSSDKKKDLDSSDLAIQAYENIQKRLHCPNQVTGIPTGFAELDQYLGGLRSSRFIVLGARPGMGKSGLALNIAVNVAIQQKRPVLFYSLEMEPVDLMERAIMAISESRNDLSKLQNAVNQIPNTLKIIDRPSLTISQLRASIIKNQLALKSIGLVVIDYLQLMKSSGGTKNEEVSNLTKELKNISREFKIPVLCLSQLSRGVEAREDKRPKKSDLRDSGSIEQDADTVLLLYRDDYYNKEKSETPNMAEVIVEKNRDGKLGTLNLAFRGNIVKFIDLDARREARHDY